MAAAGSADLAEVLKQADQFHHDEAVADCYRVLDEAYKAGERSPELLWRLGRSCYTMGNECADKAEKQAFMTRGLELVKASVEADGNNWASQKWHGILLGSMGEFVSTKEKIGNAYIIKEKFQKAAELKPDDATTHHCLGKWCWSVLQVGMIERGLAATLFATPPSSTYEECEASLLKSHELDPNQIYNNLLMGDLKYQQRKWSEAYKWYSQAAALPPKTEHAKALVAEATKKAKSCEGY